MLRRLSLAFLATASLLHAGELPTGVAAKLVLMVSKGAGEGGRVACRQEGMAGELRTAGSDVNAAGRIAWASSAEEVRMYSMQGKLVIAADPRFMSMGAGLIITEDGGRPKMMLNSRAVQKSGVQLSDSVLRAATGA